MGRPGSPISRHVVFVRRLRRISAGIIAAAARFGVWLAASVLLGTGTAMVYPTLLAVVSDEAVPAWRARGLSVYRFWRDLGYAVGALTAGILANLFGLVVPILAVAVPCLRLRHGGGHGDAETASLIGRRPPQGKPALPLLGVLLAVLSCYGTTVLLMILSGFGIARRPNGSIWAIVIVAFAALGVFGMVRRRRVNGAPLIMAVIGLGLLGWVMFGRYSRDAEVLAFALLLASAVWDYRARPTTSIGSAAAPPGS